MHYLSSCPRSCFSTAGSGIPIQTRVNRTGLHKIISNAQQYSLPHHLYLASYELQKAIRLPHSLWKLIFFCLLHILCLYTPLPSALLYNSHKQSLHSLASLHVHVVVSPQLSFTAQLSAPKQQCMDHESTRKIITDIHFGEAYFYLSIFTKV